MFKNKVLLFHLITAAVVTIWGVTFVSTKVLLQHGLGPMDIMFVISLIVIIFPHPKNETVEIN